MTALRGILRAYDAATHTATVQVAGSRATALSGLPVSKGIAAAEMVAGRNCAILEFWPNDPGASVVVAVWP